MGAKSLLIIGGAILLVAITVGITLAIAQPLVLSPNQAPWWGIPIFTLAGGLGASLFGGYFLLRNEDKKAVEARRAVREERVLNAVVDLLAIADERVTAVSSDGKWTLEQESRLWSCINRVIIIAPAEIQEAAVNLGNAYLDLSKISVRRLAIMYYQQNVTEVRGAFLRAVQIYFNVYSDAAFKDDDATESEPSKSKPKA